MGFGQSALCSRSTINRAVLWPAALIDGAFPDRRAEDVVLQINCLSHACASRLKAFKPGHGLQHLDSNLNMYALLCE
jgi:hypothetical protein